MKTFVDNVCCQVVEQHILDRLPIVFDPMIVSTYANKVLLALAAESPQVEFS